MFYLELSSPNEQQAGVMNATPIAEPSDYRPKTNLHALTYQVVCSGAYVPPFLTVLWRNITSLHHNHRQSKRAASVMRSGESKSERPEHCAQKGPKWGSKEGWGRENEMLVKMSSDCLETSDTLFLRLTFGAAISPLPCSPLFALMPLVLACARLNTNICKFQWKFSFCLCKSQEVFVNAYFTAELQFLKKSVFQTWDTYQWVTFITTHLRHHYVFRSSFSSHLSPGAGYCANQRALGAAADLEGARCGQSPPVPPF